MKKRGCFTRTDLGSSTALKRSESDSCWKRNHTQSEIHPFTGDHESRDNCLNVYQQLTRSYSWLKQNVFHSPDAESVVISNKKIKHVLREFNSRDLVVQNITMDKKDVQVQNERRKSARTTFLKDSRNGKTQLEGRRPAKDGKKDKEGHENTEHTSPTELEASSVSLPSLKKKEKEEPQVKSEEPKSNDAEPKEKIDDAEPMEKIDDAEPKEKIDDVKPKEKPDEDNKKVKPADETSTSKGEKQTDNVNKHEKPEDEKDKKMKLSEADQRAKNMAKFLEEMRVAFAEYAKKEEMTEEDTKEMLKKQEELMGKLSEFEEITKHVQDLAGIGTISSSLLGTPLQCREVNPCGSNHFDNFPKVICFDRISQHELGVPNMIVCEPVCKEKDPGGGLSHPISKKFPYTEQGTPTGPSRKGFLSDYDAERYIQKELSRELPSTEVLGMLDRQGMLSQPPQMEARIGVQQPGIMGSQIQPGMMRSNMQPQGQPGMMGSRMQAQGQPGMIGSHVQPQGQPGMVGPNMQAQGKPGMIGSHVQPQGQPGMMGSHMQPQGQPGMMGSQMQPQGIPGMMGSQMQPQGQPGMMGSQMQPGMMGPRMQPQGQPGMMGPRMQPQGQPGMMGSHMQPQRQPGMVGPQPWPSVGGQQTWPVIAGPQASGLMVPQGGMIASQPGMIVPQSGMISQPGIIGHKSNIMGPQQGILGAQGQIRMMGPQPQAVMMNSQGQLKEIGPQVQTGTITTKEPHSEGIQSPPVMKEEQGKPEITIRQQEIISTQTIKKIVGGNQFISEHSETDKAKETSIEIGTTEKPKTDAEKSKQTPSSEKGTIVDGLKKQIEHLQSEMKGVMAENKDLQKRVLMCSPEATKQMLRGRTDIPFICRKTLATTPICKLDLYRQLNLPLPSPLGSTLSKLKGGTFPQPQLQIPYQQPLGGLGPGKCRRDSSKVLCKRNILKQLNSCGEEGATRDMETMVTSMEEEVKVMQAELNAVQEERRQLEMQKNLLTCTAPAIASQSGKGVAITSPCPKDGLLEDKGIQSATAKFIPDVSYSTPPPLRDLKEQYNKLKQDYQLKIEEVSMLRVELDSARKESLASIEKSEQAEARVDELIARLKAVEDEKSKITSNKDQMIELEQQLVLAKQRYKEINEELDELRSQISDQTMQTDDYRKKFLNAQQNVEEQKRQIEMMEIESSRFGEQVTIELQRVKSQFQSKLEEMAPLPEILRKTQERLKETIHLKTLAEKNCLILSQNLEIANEQKEKLRQQLDEINKNKHESEAEKISLKINLTDGEKKMEETKAENNKLRNKLFMRLLKPVV